MGIVLILALSLGAPLRSFAVGSANSKPESVAPRIISFESEFKAFRSQAKGQAFEKQVELWTSLVEKPHQDFFDSIVWSKKVTLPFLNND